MNKEELSPWLEKLSSEADGKKRNEIVAELCKEKGLKIGDAWKLLKEAGFDPKAAKSNTGAENEASGATGDDLEKGAAGSETSAPAGAGQDTASADSQKPKKVPLLVAHKTGYEKYRCAGLVLTSKPQNYLVTEEQAEKLKRDPWVVVSK